MLLVVDEQNQTVLLVDWGTGDRSEWGAVKEGAGYEVSGEVVLKVG